MIVKKSGTWHSFGSVFKDQKSQMLKMWILTSQFPDSDVYKMRV